MMRLISTLAAVSGAIAVPAHGADIPVDSVRCSHEENAKYAATKAVDGDDSTHWAARTGRPQWIEIRFDTPRHVDRLVIRGVDAQRIYDNWARVGISFSSGVPVAIRLADSSGRHVVSFPERETSWVRVTIESTYKQSHYVGCSRLIPQYAGHGTVEVAVDPEAPPLTAAVPQGSAGAGAEDDIIARLAATNWQGCEHPNLWVNWRDVEQAKTRIRQLAWARSWFRDTLRAADSWAALDVDGLRERVPPPGSVFNSQAVCPLCGARLRASFDAIGMATCSACKRTFPDAEHPDAGSGWTDPQTGEVFHFRGTYNEYAVDQFEKALSALADAYVLTADERYARAATVLFDQLAVTYPTCTKGPEWYPGDNPTRGGRLDRPYYQVARMLIGLADACDLLYNSPEWDEPSVTGTGTRRENTFRNIIRNGGDYCFSEMTDYSAKKCLHNGYCDYLQGVLAAGRLLGIDEYVTYDLTCNLSIFNFLENTIDRDGQYIETAFMYSSHAIELYCHHAEMLRNWRSPDYPDGINLYDHPKLQLALLRSDIDIECAGHIPPLGDTGPDTSTIDLTQPGRFNSGVQHRLEYLAARSGDPAVRADCLQRLADYVGDIEAARGRTGGGMRRWLVYNAVPAPAVSRSPEEVPGLMQPDANTLLAYGRGIGIFRAGSLGQDAALLRWGPTNNHGTPDEMNVNLFALGREITYDPGYLWAHFRSGWTHATGAHNLVVVNEKNQLLGEGSGGSLDLWVETPVVEAMSADNPACYASEEVSRYRRTLALVRAGNERHYFLDLFRVRGGHTHDYNWHFYGDMDRVEGVVLPEPQRDGSLAGPEYEWWKRVQRNGWLKGVDEGFYWKAPPGNGYGFLHHLQRVPAPPACTFEWKLGEQHGRPRQCFPAPALAADNNGRYTNVLQTGVHFYRGEEPGDFVEYTLPVREAGRYAVVAAVVRHDRYGIVQAALDGKPLATPMNNYSPTRYVTAPIVLGVRELAAGEHTVRFTVTGKDDDSNGCFFGLLYLGLEEPGAAARLEEAHRLAVRLHLVPQTGTELIAARAKGTIGGDATYVISRRRSGPGDELASAFGAVVEPWEGEPLVESVRRLSADGPDAADAVTALCVVLSDGRRHLFFDCVDPQTETRWSLGGGGQFPQGSFQGRFGMLALDPDGSVSDAVLHGNGHLSVGDFRFAGDGRAAEWEGVVESVDLDNCSIVTEARLPLLEHLDGAIVDIENPLWPRRSPFRIRSLRREGDRTSIDLDAASLVMARGLVEAPSPAPGFIVNAIPLDRAGARFGPNGYFEGRMVVSDGGESWGRVRRVTVEERFDVEVSKPVTPEPGTRFSIVELSRGDRFRIVRTQVWRRTLER